MSDYNPTYTVQWRDYEAHQKAMKKYRKKVDTMREKGVPLWKRIVVKMPTVPLITEVRPNPLSMELRIVFDYLWDMYKDCLECARMAQENIAGVYLGSTAASYERDAKEAVAYAQLLCHELFAVTSPHAPFHVHSMYGCNNDDCPLWGLGFEAAQETVLEWYEPNC